MDHSEKRNRIVARKALRTYNRAPWQNKAMGFSALGGAIGFLASDKETLSGTIGDTLEGAAWSTGVGMVTDHVMKNYLKKLEQDLRQKPSAGPTPAKVGVIQDTEQSKIMAKDKMKTQITPGDLQTEEVKESLDSDKAKGVARKANRIGRSIWMATIATIGATAILDVSNQLRQETRADLQRAEQEKQLRRRRSKDQEYIRKAYGGGFNDVDMGQIVLDLYNERIGHYKMGNAKFQ